MLLASGYWGLSRYINEVFELPLSACWRLADGGSGLIYDLYLLCLTACWPTRCTATSPADGRSTESHAGITASGADRRYCSLCIRLLPVLRTQLRRAWPFSNYLGHSFSIWRMANLILRRPGCRNEIFQAERKTAHDRCIFLQAGVRGDETCQTTTGQ